MFAPLPAVQQPGGIAGPVAQVAQNHRVGGISRQALFRGPIQGAPNQCPLQIVGATALAASGDALLDHYGPRLQYLGRLAWQRDGFGFGGPKGGRP